LEQTIPEPQLVEGPHDGSQIPLKHTIPGAHGASSLHTSAHCLLILQLLPPPHDSPVLSWKQVFESEHENVDGGSNATAATIAANAMVDFVVVAFIICYALSDS
jgi:hypothetical protein